MNLEERYEALKQIKEELLELPGELADFRRENNYFPVIGQGAHDAEIMLVGEAPGENEAKQGIPFCGRSGKFLDELLASVEIPRERVYITNIVKDRPPKNRDPRPEEIEAYAQFLDRQIEIIQPRVIGTLGRFAMEYLMKRYGLSDKLGPISTLHGEVFRAVLPYGEGKLVALFHPAVALYDPKKRAVLQADFQAIKAAALLE